MKFNGGLVKLGSTYLVKSATINCSSWNHAQTISWTNTDQVSQRRAASLTHYEFIRQRRYNSDHSLWNVMHMNSVDTTHCLCNNYIINSDWCILFDMHRAGIWSQSFPSALFHLMACRMLGAKQLLEAMLSYRHLTISKKSQWNLNPNTNVFPHQNAFQNLYKMSTSLPLPQRVNIMFGLMKFVLHCDAYLGLLTISRVEK